MFATKSALSISAQKSSTNAALALRMRQGPGLLPLWSTHGALPMALRRNLMTLQKRRPGITQAA